MCSSPDARRSTVTAPPLPLKAAQRVWVSHASRLPVLEDGASREDGMDRARLTERADREQAAIETWAQRLPAEKRGHDRSVLVLHRHEWLSRRLRADLEAAGLVVLPPLADSAEAVAGLVVGQPSVMLMSDRVPGCDGRELMQRAHELSPRTACVVHVDVDDRMAAVIAGGARAVLSHRQPVEEVVARVVHLTGQ